MHAVWSAYWNLLKSCLRGNFLDLFLDEESRDAQLKGFKFGCPAVDASYLLDLLSRNFLPSTAFKGLIRGRSSDLIRFAKVFALMLDMFVRPRWKTMKLQLYNLY